MEIRLSDDTSIEGEPVGELQEHWMKKQGVFVKNAHRSCDKGHIPLAKVLFIPLSAIKFVILEE